MKEVRKKVDEVNIGYLQEARARARLVYSHNVLCLLKNNDFMVSHVFSICVLIL